MKVIGLIGGMSWESSAEYYRIINELVKEDLGGLHSARILLYSVDFAEIETLQRQGQWKEATDMMVDAAKRLEKGGADFVLICTNTMHKMADDVLEAISIPLIHIADATGEKVKEKKMKTVGLLGTKFTMEEDFYVGRLQRAYGLKVVTPEEDERQTVHEIIFKELCLGIRKESSRQRMKEIIEGLVSKGAEGVILGCTEIPLLIREQDSPVPIFDTTYIHCEAAVNKALSG
ncbi:MAG: aspartate/glutamate racemase family protein [Theionarchaea archaeon]|nr:aspartate/glutamate racemase family protein [Theionarchaea archaeon]MBU7000521.1 aspartate/glutamate racemase family protein [Theionarchaea archaeon]MBU7021564.1 aspartate/glutamate racemase family protein [Theionarchaea archaeon]MBU7034095.1 aspartate/glutamate racemase family protein [Theionarchaea archaeon]MBU7039934.1 aspartate/glutamate racemase family protein [Theionarchaea archaeon]